MMKGYKKSDIKYAFIQKCDRFIFLLSVTTHGTYIPLEDGYRTYLAPDVGDFTLGTAAFRALRESHAIDYNINPEILHPDSVWAFLKREHKDHCKQYGDRSIRRVYRRMEQFLATEDKGRIQIIRSVTTSDDYLPKKDRLPEIVVSNKVNAEELGCALRMAFEFC